MYERKTGSESPKAMKCGLLYSDHSNKHTFTQKAKMRGIHGFSALVVVATASTNAVAVDCRCCRYVRVIIHCYIEPLIIWQLTNRFAGSCLSWRGDFWGIYPVVVAVNGALWGNKRPSETQDLHYTSSRRSS